MAKTDKPILLGYNKCQELNNKWQNILDSFYHKDEFNINTILSKITETENNFNNALQNFVSKIGNEIINGRKTFKGDVVVNNIFQEGQNTFFGKNILSNNIDGVFNSAFGVSTLRNNLYGYANSAFGSFALENNIDGVFNSAFGSSALRLLETGRFNTAYGAASMYNLKEGTNNIAIGEKSALHLNNGIINEYFNTSIFIGNSTKSFENNCTNQIVFGNNALSKGSNTAVWGNGMVENYFQGNIRTTGLFMGNGAGLTNLVKAQITDLNLAEYVDKASNETIAGNKTFTGNTNFKNLYLTPTASQSKIFSNNIEILTHTTAGNILDFFVDKVRITADGFITTQGSVIANQGIKAASYALQNLNTPPATATDTGVAGAIKVTEDYIYVCVAANTWKRTPLTTYVNEQI